MWPSTDPAAGTATAVGAPRSPTAPSSPPPGGICAMSRPPSEAAPCASCDPPCQRPSTNSGVLLHPAATRRWGSVPSGPTSGALNTLAAHALGGAGGAPVHPVPAGCGGSHPAPEHERHHRSEPSARLRLAPLTNGLTRAAVALCMGRPHARALPSAAAAAASSRVAVARGAEPPTNAGPPPARVAARPRAPPRATGRLCGWRRRVTPSAASWRGGCCRCCCCCCCCRCQHRSSRRSSGGRPSRGQWGPERGTFDSSRGPRPASRRGGRGDGGRIKSRGSPHGTKVARNGRIVFYSSLRERAGGNRGRRGSPRKSAPVDALTLNERGGTVPLKPATGSLDETRRAGRVRFCTFSHAPRFQKASRRVER
eukprot:scaffold8068_cov565-Prasinococcus_capsulatus_cf.AAC.9